jgi:hypothetical protein
MMLKKSQASMVLMMTSHFEVSMDISQNITAILAMSRRLQAISAQSGNEGEVYKLAKDIMMESAALCEVCTSAQAKGTVMDLFKRKGWTPPSEAR